MSIGSSTETMLMLQKRGDLAERTFLLTGFATLPDRAIQTENIRQNSGVLPSDEDISRMGTEYASPLII
jgi:hypothetical protein